MIQNVDLRGRLELHLVRPVVLGERELGVQVHVEVGHLGDNGHEGGVDLLLHGLLGVGQSGLLGG